MLSRSKNKHKTQSNIFSKDNYLYLNVDLCLSYFIYTSVN